MSHNFLCLFVLSRIIKTYFTSFSIAPDFFFFFRKKIDDVFVLRLIWVQIYVYEKCFAHKKNLWVSALILLNIVLHFFFVRPHTQTVCCLCVHPGRLWERRRRKKMKILSTFLFCHFLSLEFNALCSLWEWDRECKGIFFLQLCLKVYYFRHLTFYYQFRLIQHLRCKNFNLFISTFIFNNEEIFPSTLFIAWKSRFLCLPFFHHSSIMDEMMLGSGARVFYPWLGLHAFFLASFNI